MVIASPERPKQSHKIVRVSLRTIKRSVAVSLNTFDIRREENLDKIGGK
jgi:hypothetical protein